MARRTLLIWVVLTIVTSACSAQPPEQVEPVIESDILDDYWVLETIDIGSSRAELAADINQPHIRFFRGNRMSGADGCNSSAGTYEIVDGELSMTSDGFWTLAGCFPSDAQQRTEDAFHRIWATIEAAVVDGDLLEVVGDGGSMVMRRFPVRRWPLDGTRWAVVDGSYGWTEMILDLDAGLLTLESECLRTTMEVEGDEISSMAGASESTEVVCADSDRVREDVRDDHGRFVFHVKQGFSLDTSGGFPLLTLANGDLLTLDRVGGSSFGQNRGGVRVDNDSVVSFSYSPDGSDLRVQVLESGAWIATRSPWEWQEGSVAAADVAALNELMADTKLKQLRLALSDERDGGCGPNGAVSGISFSKNGNQRFGCELDAAPSDVLLSRTMDIVREIIAELD